MNLVKVCKIYSRRLEARILIIQRSNLTPEFPLTGLYFSIFIRNWKIVENLTFPEHCVVSISASVGVAMRWTLTAGDLSVARLPPTPPFHPPPSTPPFHRPPTVITFANIQDIIFPTLSVVSSLKLSGNAISKAIDRPWQYRRYVTDNRVSSTLLLQHSCFNREKKKSLISTEGTKNYYQQPDHFHKSLSHTGFKRFKRARGEILYGPNWINETRFDL